MSLEAKLDTLNTLLANVITILQTGVSGQRELDLGGPGTAETTEDKPKRGRPKKDAAAEAATVYWSIPSLNSFFAQEPGMAAPTTADAVKITKEQYDLGKAQISERVDAVLASQQANSQRASTEQPAATQPSAAAAPAAAPAPTTTAASPTTQPAAAPAASPATPSDVTFTQVVEAAKALNASQAEGHGRQGVIDVLKALMPADPQPTIPKLQTSGVDLAVALKAFNDKLNPPAAAEVDLF